jgi:primosomal protein N' (replication factor Y)
VAGAAVLGPAPAPIALARGRHRHHALIKVPRTAPEVLERLREALLAAAAHARRPRVTIDVDPVGVL